MLFDFFTRPDQDLYGTGARYSKSYDFFSCAYHPYVYATGGNIWDETTGDVVGVLNTDANAKQLEYFVSMNEVYAARCRQLRHRRDDRSLHEGQGLLFV